MNLLDLMMKMFPFTKPKKKAHRAHTPNPDSRRTRNKGNRDALVLPSPSGRPHFITAHEARCCQLMGCNRWNT
jgi:hypothetical protein